MNSASPSKISDEIDYVRTVTYYGTSSSEDENSDSLGSSMFKSKKKSTSRKSRHKSRSMTPRQKRYSRSRSKSRSRSLERSYSKSPTSRQEQSDSKDNPITNKCLGIYGLNNNTTESQIQHVFSKYGAVEKVKVLNDAKTGCSRGFGFVYFQRYEDALVAKEQSPTIEIDGKKIRVDFFKN